MADQHNPYTQNYMQSQQNLLPNQFTGEQQSFNFRNSPQQFNQNQFNMDMGTGMINNQNVIMQQPYHQQIQGQIQSQTMPPTQTHFQNIQSNSNENQIVNQINVQNTQPFLQQNNQFDSEMQIPIQSSQTLQSMQSSQAMQQISPTQSIQQMQSNQQLQPMQSNQQLQPLQSNQVIQSSHGIQMTQPPQQIQPMQSQPNQSTQQVQPTQQTEPKVAIKDMSVDNLYRLGQKTVQEIVSRMQELFITMKTLQPPNGTIHGNNLSNEKKIKMEEQIKFLKTLFKYLRIIYEKFNENCQLQGMEYTHIESLIPLKDVNEKKIDEKKISEAQSSTSEESKELIEQIVLRNRQLKELINQLRRIISEVNTMLNMRLS